MVMEERQCICMSIVMYREDVVARSYNITALPAFEHKADQLHIESSGLFSD